MAALLRNPVYHGEGVPDAQGQPVVLVPGFLAGDDSLRVMTHWLRRTGHHTRKAGIRSNVNCSEVAVCKLEERVEMLAQLHQQKVALIGQSRGGNFARVLAVRRPDLVSGIVALGSPQLDPMAVHPLVRVPVIAVGALGTLGAPGLFSQSCRNGHCCECFWNDLQADFPSGVGYVSIYSRSDGIVDWHSCLDPAAKQVEIRASHCGMAVSGDAYREIADALRKFRRRAQRQQQGQRYRRAA
jgi:pimeloyl-ACP methyl ester carboxylesterase